ncbi:ABC transporter permease [Crassaminicella indica]|uniref:ABC transporter permease n=1 Tax=Crassaminicella indica TaxID=2855394 RepID=A0ABX8RBP7_9CLOT|nr:ABC transporter permease [Crassaminicella indica]QXM05330.1 ABC transporter permease [Crassaminicella indica]
MKTIITKKNSDILKTLIVILILWGGLSVIYSPIILPGPIKTLQATWNVLVDVDFLSHVLITLKRLFIGLFGAVLLGSILGLAIGECKRMKYLFEPVFHIIQATPPISWLALGMIWFGLDGQATIFIVFIASVPIMIINIIEGFENIDPKLIEMAMIFHFSKKDILFEIILPSLKSYFKSGITIAVGLGWKLVIMGEVLSSSTGIGAQITNARLNIETGKVLAWTIIIILLGVLSQKLIDFAFDFRSKEKENYGFANEQNRKKIWRGYRIKRFFAKG